MRLYESQAKSVLKANGIAVPSGRLCRNIQEVMKAVRDLQGPVAIKAQILAGGRGLAGGIMFGENPDEAGRAASEILRITIGDERPVSLLVEERMKPVQELYAGVTYDYRKKCPVIVASSRGGVDIESVAKEHPKDIVRTEIDSFKGFSSYHGRELAVRIGLKGNAVIQYADILRRLWGIFSKYDAELVEVNPLAELPDGRLVALDAKLNIDDKSTYRQSSLLDTIDKMAADHIEGFQTRKRRATALRIPTYIEMDGNMGVIADGAGSGMLTLDLVADYGGKTGVYCEMGGETTAQLIENTMLATLGVEKVKVILINLIGGLNLMDEMARGITNYLRKYPTKTPVVVRMSGTNEDEGRKILSADRIHSFDNLYEAVGKAVMISKGEQPDNSDQQRN